MQQNTIRNKKITLLTRNIPFFSKKYFLEYRKYLFWQRKISYMNKKGGISRRIGHKSKHLLINSPISASLGPVRHLVCKHYRIYVLFVFKMDPLPLRLAWLGLQCAKPLKVYCTWDDYCDDRSAINRRWLLFCEEHFLEEHTR